MKTCRDCQIEKPRTEFDRNSNKNPGLQPYCKPCALIRSNRSRNRRIQAGARPPVAEKRCPGCGEVKPGSAFSLNRSESTGLQARCKVCVEAYRRSKVYGLDAETYQRMFAEQGGRCAACGVEAKLVVDHCHRSGAVRSLLCNGCNTAEGLLGTPERARLLAVYMEAYEGRA